MTEIYIKIHNAYRRIVAVCDADLIGKKFEEGNVQIDVNEKFYKGDLVDEEKALEILREEAEEDSCFNFVGNLACELGIKTDIVNKENILEIQGIKHAISLL
ncbi:DUF424 family protein [Candidatus Pacearchaeota archaeon]|nr:DUF424 family protein [Candidatus Pacearchaeota archaeon]